ESHPLHPHGREGKSHVIEVSTRNHRESQWVRHAFAVGLAVGGETEHRLDQLLELECGPNLAHEVSLVLSSVPELVWRPRGGSDARGRSGGDGRRGEPEAEG